MTTKGRSDAIRNWMHRYGRSAWISTASTYKDWALGEPDHSNACVYFSVSDDFRVKDINCNNHDLHAVLCA